MKNDLPRGTHREVGLRYRVDVIMLPSGWCMSETFRTQCGAQRTADYWNNEAQCSAVATITEEETPDVP